MADPSLRNLENPPIHGWKERLVQKAPGSPANDNIIAKPCDRYDLAIVDISQRLATVLTDRLVPSLCDHALWLIGEAEKGKTPLCQIIAMMLSRYHGGVADLDFFKGGPFTKRVPALCDDGSVGVEETKKSKKLKTFCDVGDDESMTHAR